MIRLPPCPACRFCDHLPKMITRMSLFYAPNPRDHERWAGFGQQAGFRWHARLPALQAQAVPRVAAAARAAPGMPLFITENGCAAEDCENPRVW